MNRLYLLVAISLVCASIGCDGGGIDAATRPSDQTLANDAILHLKAELAALASDHAIIRRYGEFVALKQTGLSRRKATQIFDLRSPAALVVECKCEFSEFNTPVQIFIEHGPTIGVELSLEPTDAALVQSRNNGKAVQRADGIWWVDGSSATHGFLYCQVTHTGFEP